MVRFQSVFGTRSVGGGLRTMHRCEREGLPALAIDPITTTPAPRDGDADIIRLVEQRDETGLRLLLATHGDRTRSVLKRKLGAHLSDTEIDDALSVATFSTWSAIQRYDPAKGPLRAWFCAIAHNAGRAILRDRQRRAWETVGDRADRLADMAEQSISPPKAFLDTLRLCIRKLPRMQRRIIEADLESGDVADAGELAKSLGTTKNSVYVSRNSARKSLRRALLERGYSPGDGRSQLSWT